MYYSENINCRFFFFLHEYVFVTGNLFFRVTKCTTDTVKLFFNILFIFSGLDAVNLGVLFTLHAHTTWICLVVAEFSQQIPIIFIKIIKIIITTIIYNCNAPEINKQIRATEIKQW